MVRLLYIILLIIGLLLTVSGGIGTYNLMNIPELPDGSLIPVSVVLVSVLLCFLGGIITFRSLQMIIACARSSADGSTETQTVPIPEEEA